MADQILRTATTPCWGLAAGVATKSKAVAMLLTSCNITNNISDYEQLDSEGRRCGYLCYDNSQTLSMSGNIIYDAETDNIETIADLFTVGAHVEDENALALLDAVRILKLNGTEAAGSGTYVVKSFNISQTNTAAVEFSADIEYYGFSN